MEGVVLTQTQKKSPPFGFPEFSGGQFSPVLSIASQQSMSLPTLPFAGTLAHDYVFIRSQDRVSGNSVNFRVQLPEQYEGVTGVELIEANIPNSLYNITTNNNQVGYNVGAGPQTGGIQPGAYNTSTLPSAYPFGGGANPLQLTFNTTTMRATISSTSGAAFSLLFGTYSLGSVASVLGFQNVDLTGSSSYTGINAYDFSWPRFLFICSPQLPSFIDCTNPADNPTFIVCNRTNSGGFIHFDQKSNYDQAITCSAMKLNFLDISLRVPNNSGVAGTNNLADLGGLEWEMLLKLSEAKDVHK